MKQTLLAITGLGIIGAVIAAVLIFGPLFTIWALNLVFTLNIPVTFWTWLSVFWLQLLFVPKAGYK